MGRAAAYGDTNAMDNLAALYESGEADERGVPDYVQAIEWYTKAAEAGDREAMNNLGRRYYTAGGVEKDLEAASRWFRAAARIPKDKPDCRSMETRGDGDLSGGVPDALFNLGRVSDDRERGGDSAAAAETRCWYEMAADAGHADAMVKLGSIYETGRGVEPNVATAVEWYERAAKSNNKEAMFSLGSLYETGLGVPRDMGSALIWYARAAAQDATAELDPAELHNRYVLGSIVKLGALFQEGFREAPNLATADDWYEKAERMRESARAHARSLTPSPEVTTPKL